MPSNSASVVNVLKFDCKKLEMQRAQSGGKVKRFQLSTGIRYCNNIKLILLKTVFKEHYKFLFCHLLNRTRKAVLTWCLHRSLHFQDRFSQKLLELSL